MTYKYFLEKNPTWNMINIRVKKAFLKTILSKDNFFLKKLSYRKMKKFALTSNILGTWRETINISYFDLLVQPGFFIFSNFVLIHEARLVLAGSDHYFHTGCQ